MTSEEIITQFEVVHDALLTNDQEAVADAVIPLIDNLDAVADEELRRQRVASDRHITPGEEDADEDDTDDADASAEFGFQNMRVSMFRDQIFSSLLEYLLAEEADAQQAELIANRIEELSHEEETLRQQETEIGDDLDAEQTGAMLSISRVDQETALTEQSLQTELTVTVKNIGDGNASAGLVVFTDSVATVTEERIELPEITRGDPVTVDIEIEIEEATSESIDLYLLPSDSEHPEGIDSDEWENHVLLNAIDTFDYTLDVELNEENQAPAVIERGMSHRLTDPRDREDYAAIGGIGGAALVTGGYGTYRKFFLDNDDEGDDEGDGAVDSGSDSLKDDEPAEQPNSDGTSSTSADSTDESPETRD